MVTRWTGRAKAVAQVSTITVGGTIAIGDTLSITINGKSVTYTAVDTVIGNTVAGLVALLQAATAPVEHSELTWVNSSPTIVATAKVPGVPHTITVSETGAASTISIATTVAATGPNFYDNANNWSDGAVPTSTTSFDFADSNVSCLYGFDAIDENYAPAVVTFYPSFTGAFGLPVVNALGYDEYRQRYPVMMTMTKCRVYGGSALLQLPVQDVEIYSGSNVVLYANGQAYAITAVDVRAGNVTLRTGTSTITALRIAPEATVTAIGNPSASTITTLTTSGTFEAGALTTVTTANIRGGEVRVQKNPTTANLYAGTLILNGSDTVTTLVIGGTAAQATLDLSEDLSTFSVTNLTIGDNAVINDTNRRLTSTSTLTLACLRLTGA